MNNIDQLRQLMTLDADINTPEIELRFEQIAKMLFESALNFALTPHCDKFVKYQDKIKQIPIFQNIRHNIAPSTNEFILERMKETAEIDPLDFICEHVSIQQRPIFV